MNFRKVIFNIVAFELFVVAVNIAADYWLHNYCYGHSNIFYVMFNIGNPMCHQVQKAQYLLNSYHNNLWMKFF